jgi:hypothetical protein
MLLLIVCLAMVAVESVHLMWLTDAMMLRRKRLKTIGIALAALLALLVPLLWVRSYRGVEDYVLWRGQTATFIVHSKRGRVWFEHWRGAVPAPARPESWDLVWTLRGTKNSASGQPIDVGYSPPPPALRNAFGFGRLKMNLKPLTDAQSVGSQEAFAIPHWFFLGCALAIPTAQVIGAFNRRRRRHRGRCPRCGYDLRATPDRCPECGAATMAPIPAKGPLI